MKEERARYLIIGAGISGLTLAYYLNDDYLILEKENQAGGYCKTIKNPVYVWDYAGHFYHFKNEEMKNLFKQLVETDEIIVRNKVTKIYYNNLLVDYPFQMNIHQLDKKEFIDCLYDLYFKCEKEHYENFLDMLYGKFGEAIVEKFLKPYNEKLYATDLKMLDKDAMGRFFPYADLDAIIRNMKEHQAANTYNDSFLYLKKGTQYFIDKLADKLDKGRIRLSTEVSHINLSEKYALTQNGNKIHYQYLINTTPLNTFLKIVQDSSMSKVADEMSYNKVLVLNLGFSAPSKNYQKEHWIYYPDKNLNFYRIGFYNNILGTDKLSVYVEIGYSKNQNIDIDKELKDTLANMKSVGIIDESIKLIDYSSIIMDPAYVHISQGTDKKVHKLQNQLEKNGVFTLGRYGRWTYCSMEDCMLWAKELSVRLKG